MCVHVYICTGSLVNVILQQEVEDTDNPFAVKKKKHKKHKDIEFEPVRDLLYT